jgi:hypothetical protein
LPIRHAAALNNVDITSLVCENCGSNLGISVVKLLSVRLL